jgi:hypothetical protein
MDPDTGVCCVARVMKAVYEVNRMHLFFFNTEKSSVRWSCHGRALSVASSSNLRSIPGLISGGGGRRRMD